MKSALTAFVAFSFVSIAVFGVFAMSHGAEHGTGCIAAAAQGAECPQGESMLSFVTFHLGAFRGFSLATFGENVMSSLLLVFASLLSAGLGIVFLSLFESPRLVPSQNLFQDSLISFQRQKLISWLALREHSPAVL